MADTPDTPDPTPVIHAFTLVEGTGDGENAGKSASPTFHWRCTCGSEGKPGKDATKVYDNWIVHQQKTYEEPT